ncbi:MAG: ABC transporter permease [Deltaproteobacteria bacterium]|nr:MAG: ABC transporter permease [Deltaproteobacteria bacterium]
MDMLIRDVKYALRSLRRSPGFTAVVVAVLGLGIGVNTMIFCMVYGVLFRPWPLPHFDRVMTVQETNKVQEIKGTGMSWLNYLDLRDQVKSFESFGGFWGISGLVLIGKEPEKLSAANITSGLLPALGVKPQLGRNFTRGEEVYGQNWGVVLISDRIWRRRFGGTGDVLGRTLRINGRTRTIVGVMPPKFQWPEIADFWIPTSISADEARPRTDHNLTIVARLRPGVSQKQANAEIAGLYGRLAKQEPVALKNWTARVEGFADAWRRDIRAMMMIMSLAVAFVLLIACANVANLMLARAAGRRRELSVRLALGASRGRVVRQLLTESLVLSLAGAALGTVLAVAGNRLWVGMIPMELPFWMKFQVDLPVLLFTVLVATLSAVVFGLAPALQASDTRLSEAIREGGAQGGQGRARHRARNSLVVAEVALSLTLLVASGLMIRSLFAMMDSEHRVRAQGVLTARFLMPMATWPSDTARREFCDRVLPLVRSLPGIQSASIVTPLPLNNENSDTRIVSETGKYTDRERPLRTNYTECYPEYFSTLGIPIVDGRDFTRDDGPGAPSVVIVNQSLARALWPRENPLGRRLQTISDQRKLGWRTVVGVVPDIPQDLENTTNRMDNAMFVPHRQEPDQYLTWVLHTEGDPLSLAAPLRELLREQAPDVPLTEVRTLHESIRFAVWTHPVRRDGLLGGAAHAGDRHPHGPGRAGPRRGEPGRRAGDAAHARRRGHRPGRGVRAHTRDGQPALRRLDHGPAHLRGGRGHPRAVVCAGGVGARLPRHPSGPHARAALRVGGAVEVTRVDPVQALRVS